MAGFRGALRIAGALLLVGIAVVHAHLWFDGYRSIDVIGPLFMVDAVLAAVLAVWVLLAPRPYLPLVALAGAALAAGTAGGLLLSTRVALFGFQESLAARDAVLSLWLEGLATVVLLALAALSVRHRRRRWRGPGRGRSNAAVSAPHRRARGQHTPR